MKDLTPDQLHERANALLLEDMDIKRQLTELENRNVAILAEVAQIDERLRALATEGTA